MPVKNVELHGSHAIEVALDDVQRYEVAAAIDHQPTPREAGLVINGERRGGESSRRCLNQLQKRLQTARHSERGRRVEFCAGAGDL